MQWLRSVGRVEPAPPWSVLAAVATTVVAIASVFIGTTLASLALGNTPPAIISGTIGGMMLLGLFIAVRFGRRPEQAEALRLGPSRLPLPIVLLLSVGIALLFDLFGLMVTGVAWPLTELLPLFQFTGANALVALQSDILVWVLAALLSVVALPIAEELAFRGVILPALRASLGLWAGFLITAVLNAVFHLIAFAPAFTGSWVILWYALFLPFIDALYLNWVRLHTGSTRAAIVAHMGLGIVAVLRALMMTS
jgi:membrane protease YdiL (CAAX protease family)